MNQDRLVHHILGKGMWTESMSDFEDLFVVVPSISEAIDYIYMEELEKNL